MWMLVRSMSFDDKFGAEYIWSGTFTECMTVAVYENLGPLKIHPNDKTIVGLYDLLLNQGDEK
jgi:hypothetical protein